ncbi:MAG: SDR family NAD(P)-dependent oxidoreductase [Flavobacteriales bacterium]
MKDKKILITGVSSAIGASIARSIIDNGGEVYGTYRTQEHLTHFFSEVPKGLIPMQWSVGDNPSFLQEIPACDGWIHCIGAIHPLPIKYLNSKGNQSLFAVNYFSATEISAGLLMNKKIKTHGSIVFISSVSSHFPYRGGSTYAASKAALESFAKALALECSHLPVRVNTLVCGLVRSEMFERSVAHMDQKEEQNVLKKYPLGIGEPTDVANACLFFLSDHSRWITGSQLLLDGGLMLNS